MSASARAKGIKPPDASTAVQPGTIFPATAYSCLSALKVKSTVVKRFALLSIDCGCFLFVHEVFDGVQSIEHALVEARFEDLHGGDLATRAVHKLFEEFFGITHFSPRAFFISSANCDCRTSRMEFSL